MKKNGKERAIRQKETGITLVALVITIVIIIILTSVTIVGTFGDNGIIKKAELARDLASNSTIAEAEDMNAMVDKYSNIIGGGESPEPSYPTIEEKLKEGDYVTYPSSQGDLKCIVLYDNTSGYGVQLITSACVGSDITLGVKDDFGGNITVYNEAVGKLNEAAEAYNNSTYSTRARCVGSHPTNISDTTTYFTSSESYMSSYNGQFLNGDENYDTDYKKMQAINGGINNIEKEYWLASRYVASTSIMSGASVRNVTASGDLGITRRLCTVNYSGRGLAYSYSNGLRPVFILKSVIKVTGGDGSEGSPYELGV